jgi:hypothetical protein
LFSFEDQGGPLSWVGGHAFADQIFLDMIKIAGYVPVNIVTGTGVDMDI